MIRYAMVCYGLYGILWYGDDDMIWYDVVFFGMLWYDDMVIMMMMMMMITMMMMMMMMMLMSGRRKEKQSHQARSRAARTAAHADLFFVSPVPCHAIPCDLRKIILCM